MKPNKPNKMRFKLNQKIVYTTTKQTAYYESLIDKNELSVEEIDIFGRSAYDNPYYFDQLIRYDKRVSFKGRITNISKMSNGDTLLTVKFYVGTEIGFIKGVSDKGLRPLFLGLW